MGYMPPNFNTKGGSPTTVVKPEDKGFAGCRELLLTFLSGFDVLWILRAGADAVIHVCIKFDEKL